MKQENIDGFDDSSLLSTVKNIRHNKQSFSVCKKFSFEYYPNFIENEVKDKKDNSQYGDVTNWTANQNIPIKYNATRHTESAERSDPFDLQLESNTSNKNGRHNRQRRSLGNNKNKVLKTFSRDNLCQSVDPFYYKNIDEKEKELSNFCQCSNRVNYNKDNFCGKMQMVQVKPELDNQSNGYNSPSGSDFSETEQKGNSCGFLNCFKKQKRFPIHKGQRETGSNSPRETNIVSHQRSVRNETELINNDKEISNYAFGDDRKNSNIQCAKKNYFEVETSVKNFYNPSVADVNQERFDRSRSLKQNDLEVETHVKNSYNPSVEDVNQERFREEDSSEDSLLMEMEKCNYKNDDMRQFTFEIKKYLEMDKVLLRSTETELDCDEFCGTVDYHDFGNSFFMEELDNEFPCEGLYGARGIPPSAILFDNYEAAPPRNSNPLFSQKLYPHDSWGDLDDCICCGEIILPSCLEHY